LPRLGLTFHAGEDYYHPLDGIRTMWNAVNGTGMLAGDRIGHGLAAGADIEDHQRNLMGTNSAPGGDILDSLAWLYCRLAETSGQERLMRNIADEICASSLQIYGRCLSPSELALIKKFRHRPPLMSQKSRGSIPRLIAQCLKQEVEDPQIRQARRQTVRYPDIFSELNDGISQAQSALSLLLAERGIVLEINPSSNWATGAIALPARHPALLMKKLAPHICIALNCDDPGTFATRVENEYALILEAFMANGEAKEEAIAHLAHMSQSASNSAF
jgi:hypothetical protein